MTRDREQTEQGLIRAVGRVLARDGFERLGINAIAREAGTDKVLIYRYFDGLPNLLRAYAESADFWPSVDEVIGKDEATFVALPIGERMSKVSLGLLEALRNRPQTIEILAWEAVHQNTLTEALATIREQWSRDVIAKGLPEGAEHQAETLALTSLLVAGLQYLLIRSRMSPLYGGLELQTEAGWQRITAALCGALGALGVQGRHEAARPGD